MMRLSTMISLIQSMTICHHLGMTEMKMRSLKNTFNKNDELYTPPILVEPIVKYIEDFVDANNCSSSSPLIIWCPFDKKDSEFVKVLSKIDYVKVVYSHIDDGYDFFEYEPKEWDVAVSNPPFSRKKEVFERLFKLHKPFAMVMNLMAINYQEIGNLFIDKDVQMLIPDISRKEHVAYIRNNEHPEMHSIRNLELLNSPSFPSCNVFLLLCDRLLSVLNLCRNTLLLHQYYQQY